MSEKRRQLIFGDKKYWYVGEEESRERDLWDFILKHCGISVNNPSKPKSHLDDNLEEDDDLGLHPQLTPAFLGDVFRANFLGHHNDVKWVTLASTLTNQEIMHRFTSHLRERRERRQHREEKVTARLKGESCIPGHLIPADLVDHLCTFIPRTHLRKICEVGLRSEPLAPVPVPHPAGTRAEGDNKNKVQIRMLLQGSDTCKLMLVAPSTT